MLRVVHVLHGLGVGGTENGVANLVTRLGGGFRHTLISMTMAGPLATRVPADVAIHCLGKQAGVDWRAMRELARLLRLLRPQVVHSRNWGALDAVLAAWPAGIPVVIHGEHGREIADPLGRDRRRRLVRRALSPMVDRFVTVSEDLHRWLIADIGICPRKVQTIPNGVDTERFAPGDPATSRVMLGLDPARPVVGTIGRLDPVKDQAGLVRAFASVRMNFPDAGLVIAGDGPCRRELEALIASLDLGARVRLLGEQKDVPMVLRAMDVFVLPSIAEGMSNTILEAMASGLPVVATRTGGNPELVEDGVTGTLVPVGDPEALAGAIAGYLGDPVRRTSHGQAARQRAVERFDLGKMVAAYRDLYLALARQKAL
jgi:sugar transferase (PEP-CTERM/EpsH1 system associated)